MAKEKAKEKTKEKAKEETLEERKQDNVSSARGKVTSQKIAGQRLLEEMPVVQAALARAKVREVATKEK